MTIRVKGGLNHLKNKCCSSWGTTKDYYTSMNINCQTWKLSPKDCMVIQLRSGKDLSNNKRKERKEETEAEQEESGKEGEKSTQIEQPKGSKEQKQKEGVPSYTPSVPLP